MSNFAALISDLSITGSRLTDGTANASGVVWFFQPGTNTTVNVYADAEALAIVTQPITLGEGGKLPSQYPDGVFATQPVRILIQDVNGSTVTDNVYIPATAGDTGVNNAGFSGTTMDDVLTAALTSFGGQDFKYLVALGGTSISVKSALTALAVNVKSFGALGDGVNDDTNAIQSALNFVKAAGGGIVWFPPGTYKVSSALSVTGGTSVRLVGAGSRASVISTSHATDNTLNFTTCTACQVENIRIDPSGANSGSGINILNCTDFGIHRLTIKENHAAGLNVTGTSNVFITQSSLVGTAKDISFASTGTPSVISQTVFAGSTMGVELTDVAQDVYITNCKFRGQTGVKFTSDLTGTNFVISGCPTLGACTTPLDIQTLTIPVYRQWGNKIEASATSSATGAAQTPFLYKGNEVILTAASGGAGTVTVNAPAVLPGTSTADVDLYWDFVFVNGAGGAVTWTLNAVFVTAAAVPTTDGHTVAIRFRWDRTASKLREVSRADTVT